MKGKGKEKEGFAEELERLADEGTGESEFTDPSQLEPTGLPGCNEGVRVR